MLLEKLRDNWLDMLATCVAAVCVAFAYTTFVGLAYGEDRHAQGHVDYSTWASKKTGNCCSNQDCHYLNDEEWQENDTGTQVRIEGQWCPVLSEHWLVEGRSPDWEHAHACISPKYPGNTQSPCERLLCFTPRPKV